MEKRREKMQEFRIGKVYSDKIEHEFFGLAELPEK